MLMFVHVGNKCTFAAEFIYYAKVQYINK